MPLVTGTIVCSVCGTVNVGVFARCIACGQKLGEGAQSRGDEPDTGSRENADVPISQERDVSGPIAGSRPVTRGGTGSRSSHAEAAELELESASYKQTVVEMPKVADTAAIDASSIASARRGRSPRGSETGPAPTTPDASPDARFVARLLLPEGDRRSVEITRRPIVLGSGLDELGLPGDPRVRPAEARIWLESGRLFIEPAPDSCNVYRRIDREMKLQGGDVVLVGDIAALFTVAEPPSAVDGSRQVLGGSANAPCGRLVFLRRDGTPGPVHDLPAGKTVLGRTDGHLNFPGDSRLSRRHALFFASDQGVTLEDMDSRNGTYLRIREKQELRAEDALRIGSAGLQIRAK